MTPAGAHTVELSRASAANAPSVHRLCKDELIETTTTRVPYISSHRLREKDMGNEQTHTEQAIAYFITARAAAWLSKSGVSLQALRSQALESIGEGEPEVRVRELTSGGQLPIQEINFALLSAQRLVFRCELLLHLI
jgi:hypothetical protein